MFNSTVGDAHVAHLNGDTDFDATARQALLKQRPQSRLDVAERVRHAELEIEKPMVHRSYGHGNRRTLVLVRQRCETGHGLDHRSCLGPRSSVCDCLL